MVSTVLINAILKIIIEFYKKNNIFSLFRDMIYDNRTKIENNNRILHQIESAIMIFYRLKYMILYIFYHIKVPVAQ